MAKTTLAAIDLGATSGRVIVGTWSGSGLDLTEAHRFPNGFSELNGSAYWDLGVLFKEIKTGLLKARELFPDLQSCGVDTWGVDFVLTNNDGRLAFPAHAYRDVRTNSVVDAVRAQGKDRWLFDRSGIPMVNYNTSFQLAELLQSFPDLGRVVDQAMLLPHYFNFLLSGVVKSEYSEASTTQLLNVEGDAYCQDIFEHFSIPSGWLIEPERAGQILGPVRIDPLLEGVQLALVPGHDTSCAFEVVPRDGNTFIVSTGTWMLAGAMSDKALLGDEAFESGISNERCGDGSYRPNKILLGLWLLEQTIPSFDKRPQTDAEWGALISAAEERPDPDVLLNIRDRDLFNPQGMRDAIDGKIRSKGGTPPDDLPGYMRLICASLGAGVCETMGVFENIMAKEFDNVVIVGGGSKNRLLCQLIANACGKAVTSYNLEASSVGNMAYQLLALGEIESLKEFQDVLRPSLSPKVYKPQ